MKKILKYLFWLLLFFVLIILLKILIFTKRPIPVNVYKVQKGLIEEIVANTRAGTLKTRLKAKLSPQTAGLVQSIKKKKGEFVKKGELILKIDDSIQRANFQAIEKQKEAAEARLKEAEVALNLSIKEEKRAQELFHNNIISEEFYDKAKAEKERAESAYNSSKALLKQAEAELKLAKEQLNLTELKAPFNGYISEIYTEVGEWITPSPTGIFLPPVIEIINLDELYVSAPIDEMDSKKVKISDEVRVTIDSYPERVFEGKLKKIGIYVQDLLEQNRTVEVEVQVDLEGLNILTGTSADIEIIINKKEDALRIPTTAISSEGNVFVLDGRILKKRSVKTGLQNWAFTEVLEGLKEGELVVSKLEITDIKEGLKAYPLKYD